jgi:hypothetical protein
MENIERIRLSNGTEFTLIPMGIEERDRLRYFKFTSDLNYYDILAEFENSDNLAVIEHILADGSVGATYNDCVSFKTLTYAPDVEIGDKTVTDIYIVCVGTDAVERTLQALNTNIDDLTNVIAMMSLGGERK